MNPSAVLYANLVKKAFRSTLYTLESVLHFSVSLRPMLVVAFAAESHQIFHRRV
jgi:hypothetical protein